MNWKQIDKLEFTEKEMEVINFYCKDELKELRKITIPLIKQKGVDGKDYDDLLDNALTVLMESVKDYNVEKSKFETFLTGNIKRSFYDWTRDSMRGKRCNLERDKKGKIKYKEDENGKKILTPIRDVSYDVPTDDGIDLREKISMNKTTEFSEGLIKYLDTLTENEKKIAYLVIEGYSLKEIQKMTKLSDKKFQKILTNMKNFERHRLIHSEESTFIKEEKRMNIQQTTLEKSKPDRLSIASINKKIENQTIRFNHPLQRESEQWSNIMKGNLISDILQENPIPALTFAEQIVNGLAIIWDLDGKQRCTTAYRFSKDDFKISRNIRRYMISYQAIVKDEKGNIAKDEEGFPLSERREFDIRNKKFSDLPEELKDKFLDYNFEIVQYLNCSSEDIAYHIARYNEGKPMNKQQKGIIQIGEYFASLVKGISAMPFFKELGDYGKKDPFNGVIDRVVIESVMMINFLDDWNKDVVTICDYIKKNATEEVFEEFEDIVVRLTNVGDEEFFEKFNSKDSFIWFGLFGRFIKMCNDDKKFVEFMAEFTQSLHNKKVNGVSFDDLCVDKETGKTKSTKDKYIVVPKMEILTALMKEFLHIEENNDETENEIVEQNNEDIVEEHFSNKDIIIEDSESSENTDILKFCQEAVSPEIDKEDVELYSDMVDDCVKIDSPIYQDCKNALIGVMGFAIRQDKDEEFEDWIEEYQKEKSNFSPSQRKNFMFMKNDFCNYLNNQRVAVNA